MYAINKKETLLMWLLSWFILFFLACSIVYARRMRSKKDANKIRNSAENKPTSYADCCMMKA